MKLVIAGKSWIACRSLEYVFDLIFVNSLDIDLWCLPAASDPAKRTWQPSLKETAASLGVPIASNLGSIDVSRSDLLVSLEYDRIFKAVELDRLTAFNIHFSDLPRYRGSGTSVWPIRNGETTAGVTLHRMDPGVDDGPIVAQRLFPLDNFMTAFDLYRAYNAHGFELFCSEFEGLLSGNIQLHDQDSSRASLYLRRDLDFSRVEIGGFDRPARVVRDFARSLIFPPYQLPTYEGRSVFGADVVPDLAPTNASRVSSDSTRAIVRCADAWLRLAFTPDGNGLGT